MESLVLNTAAIPIEIISHKRAISLVYAKKRAIVLASYQDTLFRSASLVIPIPSVIQCTHTDYMPKKFTNVLPFTRENVYIRDQGCCQYCGKKVRLNSFTFDHIIPKCQGGKSWWTNIVIACSRCNSEKGCRSLKKYKRPLLRQPYIPMLDKAAPSQLVNKIAAKIPHVTWEDYIYWHVILEN